MPDIAILFPILIVVLYLFSSIKILAEYERGVVFRLGRVLAQPKGWRSSWSSSRLTGWYAFHFASRPWKCRRRTS